MFGVDSTEFVIVAVLALVFIGPKDLPRVMRTLGQWIGRVRGMARHFTAGIETMMREAELEEMEKKWREENERIMKLYPPNADYPEPSSNPAPDDDHPPMTGPTPGGAEEEPAPPPPPPPPPPLPDDPHPRPGFAIDDDDPRPPEERELP